MARPHYWPADATLSPECLQMRRQQAQIQVELPQPAQRGSLSHVSVFGMFSIAMRRDNRSSGVPDSLVAFSSRHPSRLCLSQPSQPFHPGTSTPCNGRPGSRDLLETRPLETRRSLTRNFVFSPPKYGRNDGAIPFRGRPGRHGVSLFSNDGGKHSFAPWHGAGQQLTIQQGHT